MPRTGRRPRSETKMPNTSVTGTVEELTWLMLFGDGTLSRGLQQAVKRLATIDPESEAIMKTAVRVKELAEAELIKQHRLAKDATIEQIDTYRHITDNYRRLVSLAEKS